MTQSCSGRDDLDGRRRALPGLEPQVPEHQVDIGDNRVAYDLYHNRAAAVVHSRGLLVIDCGTADLAKYVEGGQRSHWVLGEQDGGVRAALIDGLGAELYVPIDRDPGGVGRARDGGVAIWIRARATRKGQLVSVFLNQRRLGDISMPEPTWKSYAIRAPASALVEGENELRLYFRHRAEIGEHQSPASIARISIGHQPPDGSAMVGAAVSRGGARVSALRLAGPGRLSYYLRLPRDRPQLVFSHAGKATRLAVQVAEAGSGAAATVWTGKPGKGWKDARVDLADYAGDVVRLDLVSDDAADWGRPRVIAAPVPPRPKTTRPIADHVIIWAISALRSDRFAGAAVPTPAFARFASRATRFDNALTNSPLPGPAHVALLTGRRPESQLVDKGARTLGERFRAAGYATALISGNGFVTDERGFAQGFDLYSNPMRLRHPFGARILWQKAKRVLSKHKNGHSFIYLVAVEPHLPYTPSPESLALEWHSKLQAISPAETAAISEAVRGKKRTLTAEERSFIEALYNAAVRDVDAAFAEMLGDLEKLGIAGRTAVIVVADHGEELFERGNFGHGDHLHEEVLSIPLVVHLPGQSSGSTSDAPVESVDVYVTALSLAGIAADPESQGRNLLSLAGERDPLDRPILVNLPGVARALHLGRHKLVVPARGKHQLFDLVSDPTEQHNLIGKRPIVERYLRNVFGIAVAYRRAWSYQRWGHAANLRAAFGADHGL